MNKYPDFKHEEEAYSLGFLNVVGVDEVGRGPGFGPVVAAAVRMPPKDVISFEGRLKDSKKLSENARSKLAKEVASKCDVGLGVVDNKVIDDINILEATKLAMRIALYDLGVYDFVFIDGTVVLEDLPAPQKQIIKGDNKVISISAASVIAKVVRDNMMNEIVLANPRFMLYNIGKNKGYLTKEHREAIALYGPTELHRLSFRGVKEHV